MLRSGRPRLLHLHEADVARKMERVVPEAEAFLSGLFAGGGEPPTDGLDELAGCGPGPDRELPRGRRWRCCRRGRRTAAHYDPEASSRRAVGPLAVLGAVPCTAGPSAFNNHRD